MRSCNLLGRSGSHVELQNRGVLCVQVSSSASQGTLAAATFLAGLRSSPATQLAGVTAAQGPFTISSSQIQDKLVTLTPGSVPPAPASTPFTIPADVGSISSPSTAGAAPEGTPAATPAATPEVTPAATLAATPAATSPSLPGGAGPVGATGTAGPDSPAPMVEPTPPAPPVPAPFTTAAALAGTPPGASQAPPPPPPSPPPPSGTGQASPTPPQMDGTQSAVPEPTSAVTPAPGGESPAATVSLTPTPTPNLGEAAPEATPPSPLLAMNLSVAFPPSGIAAAQDLASTLFNQSQKDLYAVVSLNGDIVFSDVVYGSQPIPLPSFAPAPGPGVGLGGPAPAPVGAAAPEEGPPSTSGAAIESYTGPVRWLKFVVHVLA
ncbi:hypothetical protein ABBQ38_010578 [Trebouxia sp. C0009 RCD-2024]